MPQSDDIKLTRDGPHPLSLHLGMASVPGFDMLQVKDVNALQQEHAQHADNIQNMLEGIKLYQTHPYRAAKMQCEEVWREGQVSITVCSAEGDRENAPAILLVPSLINKSDVFDLNEQRSMMRWLSAKGMDVYLLDWGDLRADDHLQNLDALIVSRLIPAITAVSRHADRPVFALGYCMGGTLLLGAAQGAKDHLAGLILLSTPWDFKASETQLINQIKFWLPMANKAVDEQGFLPVRYIQSLFASIGTNTAIQKFTRFAQMDQDSDEAKLFIATEDWLNEGCDLPADIARECIEGWFLNNIPGNGQWYVGTQKVDLAAVDLPVFIAASDKDNLVSYKSAVAVREHIPSAQHINPHCGHIGMIAGRKAIENVWTPIYQWIETQL